MLKSCFGLAPLRTGVNVFAVINMIFIGGELSFRCLFHLKEYLQDIEQEIYWRSEGIFDDISEINSTSTPDQIPKPFTIMTFQDHKSMSAFIYFMWTVLILITNIGLKQSTFIPALQKIYAWLVINYVTLLCLVIHMVNYITLFKKAPAYTVVYRLYDSFVGSIITNFMFVIIFIIETLVVHSYYIEEQKTMLNDVIQLKWKHVSKSHVLSQGTAYPSASTFKETMSRQTQEGISQSKIPPFVTNVFLDRD